jgi:hypothetical protein
MFSTHVNTAFNIPIMNNAHPTFQRFMQAADELKGLTDQAEIARQLNVLDQHLTNWKRRGLPRHEFLDLAQWLGCNPYWLRDGKGPMVLGYPSMTDDVRHVVEKLVAAEPAAVYKISKMVDLMTDPAASNDEEPNGNHDKGGKRSA